jgi:hypothetical protein
MKRGGIHDVHRWPLVQGRAAIYLKILSHRVFLSWV